LAQQEIVPETVVALRDAARALLKDEDERANSLNSSGSALVGFVGVILSVAAAAGLAAGRSSSAELQGWVKVVVALLMVGALAALVTAVFVVVLGVLRPTPGYALSTDDTDKFKTAEFYTRKPEITLGYLMRAYVESLKTERRRNATKAKWLKRSYYFLCGGLAAVSLAGFVATLDRYVGDEPEPEPRRSRQRADGRERTGASPAFRVLSAERGESVSSTHNGGARVRGRDCPSGPRR
jgi:hypothetical protein